MASLARATFLAGGAAAAVAASAKPASAAFGDTPSRAAYTGLAASRSDTGCSTFLIPWVAESVMVAPEVVGLISMVVMLCAAHDRCFSIPDRFDRVELIPRDQWAPGRRA